jgi:hypothetical protein
LHSVWSSLSFVFFVIIFFFVRVTCKRELSPECSFVKTVAPHLMKKITFAKLVQIASTK